jgi:hypothetical protein
LVPACTSFRALELWSTSTSDLSFVLELLPAPLSLLDVGLRRLSPKEETQLTAELLTLLDKPGLSMLKRWRLYGTDTVSKDALSAVLSSEKWEEACRARGIEPRGDERYYTGECALVPVYRL